MHLADLPCVVTTVCMHGAFMSVGVRVSKEPALTLAHPSSCHALVHFSSPGGGTQTEVTTVPQQLAFLRSHHIPPERMGIQEQGRGQDT